MMKPFLSFPVETMSPVSLFPNFNTMDPVQKAVINHTFGVSMVIKKKQVISCNVCQLRFNSDSQADAHYRGSRHAKKLKSQENKSKPSVTSGTNGCSSAPAGSAPAGSAPPPASPAHSASALSITNQHPELLSSAESSSSPPRALLLSSSSPSSSPSSSTSPPSSSPSALPCSSSSSSEPPHTLPPGPSHDEEEQKARKLLYCSLCKVAVNSLSQLEAHNAGSKHQTMLEARRGSGPIKSFPRPGAKLKIVGVAGGSKGTGLQDKTFHCQICDVHVNSDIQLKQHISSRRHKDKVAGKPSKPKYSPYSKQPELVKPPVSPSFLTSSISLPPSSFSSSPLSLHPQPPPVSSLFAASFLRPAPGPIRTSQGSILFTPY
ncbi:zinc finger protein 385B isoform X2 [Genypterus blacodes]|uniref:zinc finger protein 385B isoform X2 n=1 Tax=Genypterus blacodes TaxID=154954 RepID=UPI003F761CF1